MPPSSSGPLVEAVPARQQSSLRTGWRGGALLGASRERAFCARCDRTTMTQRDADHGRPLFVLGVAPLPPAEFEIVRIAQPTARAVCAVWSARTVSMVSASSARLSCR